MNLNSISVLTKHVSLCRNAWRKVCAEHVLGRRYMTFTTCKPIRFAQCTSKLVVTMLPCPRLNLRAGVALPVLPARTLSLTACMFKSKNRSTDINNLEEEDEMYEAELEELFQQQIPTGIGEEHRVFIVHPDVKWGSRKQYLTTGNSIHWF